MLLGHCTKWVSSSLPLQLVHFSSGPPPPPPPGPSWLPLLELDTWSPRDPGVGGPVYNGQVGRVLRPRIGLIRLLTCPGAELAEDGRVVLGRWGLIPGILTSGILWCSIPPTPVII